jgi:hypothetical protein
MTTALEQIQQMWTKLDRAERKEFLNWSWDLCASSMPQPTMINKAKQTMKQSALDMYTPRYADQLPPKAQQILAQLSDNVVQLAFDAAYSDDDEMSEPFPANDEDRLAYWARQRARARAQLRREVPALNALSDEDLDVVIGASINAAIDVDLDREPGERKPRP